MNDGKALLAQLDAGLAHGAGDPSPAWEAGLAAATRLNALLAQHHLGWHDVVAPGTRLAKLCGRLGSEYPAEREAAYRHAVRLILRSQTSWSALVGLPEALSSPPAAIAPPPPAPDETPPEESWIAIVRRLNRRAAWRTATEQTFLASLEDGLASGQDIGAVEAGWVRDIWWDAELNDPDFMERFE
jgi:hypothetical protein